ncbi:hypothetical protein K9M43_00345, partial [Candidatus Gracilibacteria bacterium]|nr:hypothetical protein [Candidatus Gracilibacteria bacterium]
MESARRSWAARGSFGGIGGTGGGAVVGNANAIGEKVSRVKLLSMDGEEITVVCGDLEFSYRDSNLRGKILVEAEFELEKTHQDLTEQVAHLAREKATKHPFDGTAGSWFKNTADNKAWELIEKAGCRGLKVGGAQVSEKHANFFQNSGEATAADFLTLEKIVVEKVQENFGVRLEQEVVVVCERGFSHFVRFILGSLLFWCQKSSTKNRSPVAVTRALFSLTY